MGSRLTAVYRIRGPAASIAERAEAVAVEQSVEMPLVGIHNRRILDRIVGRVESVTAIDDEQHEVCISLASETIGSDAGQLLNMLFGNSSLHEDVSLHDFDVPDELARHFSGPRHGADGLRRRASVEERSLTAAALKPQGLAPADLASLAESLAAGGVDYIKDDHGLANQAYARFDDRVRAIADAMRRASDLRGRPVVYVPSLSGDLDACAAQIERVLIEGLHTVLVAPMILGVSNVQKLARTFPEVAFIAHPTMAGIGRISPQAHYGKLFRLIGADGVIFPNHGGRFGYSAETCQAIARTSLAPWHGLKPAMPIPAGGMTVDRAVEMIEFYGRDVMLLVGGALLAAGGHVTDATVSFVNAVSARFTQAPS